MQILNGYIKIHRKMLNWEWYTDPVVKCLFLHLLLTASFRESQWRGRTVQKGQVITSYPHLAKELGFSVSQIRTALNKLKLTGEVTCETTNRFTVITLENWEKYQTFDFEEADERADDFAGKGQSDDSQMTVKSQHLKNVNNNKECKEGKENNTVGLGGTLACPVPPGMTQEEYERRIREATE